MMGIRRVRDIAHEFEQLDNCCKASVKRFIGDSVGDGIAPVPVGGIVLMPFRVKACRVNNKPLEPEVIVDLVKIDFYGDEEPGLEFENVYIWPGNAATIDDISELAILIPSNYDFERPTAASVESIELLPNFPVQPG